jgi:hypothetical protein
MISNQNTPGNNIILLLTESEVLCNIIALWVYKAIPLYPLTGGPPILCCLQPLILFVCSYPPYMEAVCIVAFMNSVVANICKRLNIFSHHLESLFNFSPSQLWPLLTAVYSLSVVPGLHYQVQETSQRHRWCEMFLCSRRWELLSSGEYCCQTDWFVYLSIIRWEDEVLGPVSCFL